MSKLLMISGDRALALGKRGAFYNTLEEFHKYWDRIDVICPQLDGSAEQIFDNVFVHSSPWPLFFQPLFIFKKGLELFRAHKFDLLTVHEYPPFYNGLGARLLWGKIKVPYILEIHHLPGIPKASSIKEKIYCIMAFLFLGFDSKKAKAVRVVNQGVPKWLRKMGIPESKIKYIPSLYIDLDIFKPQNLEKKYDLIFVGRLVKNKGLNLFIEAAKKINARAIIIGEGPLKGQSSEKIEFHGWAKDSHEVARLLNESKVLVMPSYNEGGPRVVVEAMACGVPVVATAVGVVLELLKESVGWNADDIAAKAKELLNNPEKYQQLKDEGLATAQRFEKKDAIANYAAKLKELI